MEFGLKDMFKKRWTLESAQSDLAKKLQDKVWLENYRARMSTSTMEEVLEQLYPGLGKQLKLVAENQATKQSLKVVGENNQAREKTLNQMAGKSANEAVPEIFGGR